MEWLSGSVLGCVFEGSLKCLQVMLHPVFRREKHANKTDFSCSEVFCHEKGTVLTRKVLYYEFGCYWIGNKQWGKAKEVPPRTSDCPCTCTLSTNQSALVRSAINFCKLGNKTAWLTVQVGCCGELKQSSDTLRMWGTTVTGDLSFFPMTLWNFLVSGCT